MGGAARRADRRGRRPRRPRARRRRRDRVRRGARVVVAAPYEGPLRDATAGHAAVLAPRLGVPDEFGLCRYLAAGLAVVHAVDPRPSVDLALLADELDAEALRNSAARELFTNPAKLLAARIADRQIALAGDGAATLALARHGSSVLLRIANQVTPATGLADAVVALRAAASSGFGGGIADRTPPCSTTRRSTAAAAAAAGAGDHPGGRADGGGRPDGRARRRVPARRRGCARRTRRLGRLRCFACAGGPGRVEQQLAVLAVRLEMAAVYMRLVRG